MVRDVEFESIKMADFQTSGSIFGILFQMLNSFSQQTWTKHLIVRKNRISILNASLFSCATFVKEQQQARLLLLVLFPKAL